MDTGETTRFKNRKFFLVALGVKTFDGLLALIFGITILFISKSQIHQWAEYFVKTQLSNDEGIIVAKYLLQLVSSISLSTQQFAAIYLIGDGAVKLSIAYGILREKIRVYYVGFVFFSSVILFQIYRLAHGHSKLLIIWLAFDLFFMVLLIKDYRKELKMRELVATNDE
ncbi:DUF2127 domain-containing protein [Candidatus Saccharibacteria bacterium]|nr:DUF2127 domain-containing protein [Candidatus Saccharibacteria bacterium]